MAHLTLAQQLAASLAEQIGNGTYRVGDRLPSLRECMRLFGHSKNTVINAYEALASQGLVEARHGQGFFVKQGAPNGSEPEEPPPYARAMDTIWLMRQQFVREPGQSPLGEGFAPVEWLMDMRLDKFTRQIMRTGVSTLFRYGNRLGNASLRQHLVQKLAAYSISATPRQIVTTHGANHALDLIIRRFVGYGDTVLVEDPGYYPLFGKLQLQGARMLPVPRLPDGPDLDVLEQHLREHKPKLFFIQSIGHNPTGSDLSPSKAFRLVQLAQAHNLILVDDDALADFKPASGIRVSALDQLQRSLYVGSFSKSVSAALRVGFIAGSKELIDELGDLKMLLHTSSSEFCERTVDVILTEGHFLRHLIRLQERLRSATDSGLQLLDEIGAEVFVRPEQSLYLWARFAHIDDARELTRRLLPKGFMIAPGHIFSPEQSRINPWTRLNVAYLNDPRLKAVLQR
ncbi:PLP-dependent aminotransferase family protein [Pseudomonas sp. TH05]|uniref:aminotransferase-like domain-containing protein n=1 Tax=unclassified Pseudomonas TaxID=196821 RepID=UPI00191412E9|nr:MULTISPECIES: PLP-dependent aminotransferase family protein [unclassified Pseudomonas]MBK5541892.1 PLP-dependent aminotransferase family protein [Pseudomonas sp. TH07]MBK5557612.1 PLP-dependent aminotransferase family protein [Pseudomonas sp. TH05]